MINNFNEFHLNTGEQNKTIRKKNFTYRYLIQTIENYISKGDQVLDIGCGSGTIDFYLSKFETKILGVDISSKAISRCQKSSKILKLDELCKFTQVDLSSNFPLGKYDLILCLEVLEHIPNETILLTNIYKSLKKNGKLILSVPSIKSPLYKLGLTKNHDKKVGHLRRYSKESLIKLLIEYRFKIIKIEKREGFIRNFLFIFNTKLTNLIIKIFNKVEILSDIMVMLDNIFILFGESQIIVVVGK